MKKPSSVGEALRQAGYKPLPRLWVPTEDLEMILWIAKKHGDAVNKIRQEWEKDE